MIDVEKARALVAKWNLGANQHAEMMQDAEFFNARQRHRARASCLRKCAADLEALLPDAPDGGR